MKYLVLLILLIAIPLKAQDPVKIIDEAENSIKGKTSKGTFKMVVVTPEFTRTLEMDSWWEGNEKALIVITSPAKDKGNKTLKIGKEMWNFLKNTEKVIKVPPSMMLQSWNGSDLTNDDLVRDSKLSDDYNIKLILEERIAGEDCWKLELIPKPDLPVVWGKIYYWVRKSDHLPALVQYYDEKGEKYRTMQFSGYKEMGGRKIPTVWKFVSNKKENHYTKFIILNVEFDVNIPDRIFSRRELER